MFLTCIYGWLKEASEKLQKSLQIWTLFKQYGLKSRVMFLLVRVRQLNSYPNLKEKLAENQEKKYKNPVKCYCKVGLTVPVWLSFRFSKLLLYESHPSFKKVKNTIFNTMAFWSSSPSKGFNLSHLLFEVLLLCQSWVFY